MDVHSLQAVAQNNIVARKNAFTLKLLTFSQKPEKSSSIMKKFLRLLFKILWGHEKASDLALENLALRQQVAAMKLSIKRPQIRNRDRLFWILLSRYWSNWQQALIIVKPETVVRWHRKGFKLYWGRKCRRKGPGRPRVSPEIGSPSRRPKHGEHF